MKKYKYFLAYDDGNVLLRYTDTYNPEELEMQKYDRNKNIWVTDYMVGGIFSGDIPVKEISEEELHHYMSS